VDRYNKKLDNRVLNISLKMRNRLIGEKSHYLLHHAHNPVNWFPWSEEAFDGRL
jgi:uncharacterized protein YyaL (SSP411 family)